MRSLVLHHEGAPMLVSMTAGPIKARILEWPDDDADLFRVWSVPTDDSHTPAHDMTEQFAATWAKEFRFGLGIEPHDYLAPFPAFVRHHAERVLIGQWQSTVARADAEFIPNPMRRAS